MRRQPKARTTNRNRVRMIFDQRKAQSRRRENKVELEINMERMGSKIRASKFLKFKDHVIMDNFSLIFNVAKGES
jgi:ATP-binding cassette subfamily F protein uup